MSASRASNLLICSSYPPVLGGSEIEAQRVAVALRERGHWVKVVTMGGDPMPSEAHWTDPFGVPVRSWGAGWAPPWNGYLYALGTAWTLYRERRNYDVAYFLMQGAQLAAGLPVARLLRKPIVMKFSGSGVVKGMADSWLGRLELRFLNWWACRILILNPGMVEEAKAAGVSPALLGWMPNPVDTDQFQPCTPEQRSRIRRDLNIAEDARLIVFVGRLGPEKEIPSLIGALRQVVKQQPHARLALIGDGPLREELARLVQEADVGENVIFTGRLTTSEVVRWLQAGDIFTLVSSLEGLPCSLIEAMAVGMAAVASNIPAHTQLIGDRENGLLTEVRGEESIAKALLGLMDDPGLRASMGAAARRCALERFSTPIVVDCYEKLFAECSRQ